MEKNFMFTKMPDKQDFYYDVIDGAGAGLNGVYTREEYLALLEKHLKGAPFKYIHTIGFNYAAYESAVNKFLSEIENPLLRVRAQILLDDSIRDYRKFQLFGYIFNLETLLEKLTNLQVKNVLEPHSWGRILTDSPKEVSNYFANLEYQGEVDEFLVCHIKDFDGEVLCTDCFNFEMVARFVDWAKKKKILFIFVVA